MRVVDPDIWRNCRVGRRPQSLRRLRHAGTRTVSVHRAAARVRRGAREIRHGDAQEDRHAAVARGRGVRQPAACLRGIRQEPGRTRRPIRCCFRRRRRITSRTPISRSTRTNNYDGQLTQQNGIHSRFETATVRALRVAADGDARPGCRRSPTRATPRSTSCWPAISSSISCSRPTRTRSPARTRYDDRVLRAVLRGGPPDPREAAGGFGDRDRRR